MIVVADHEQVPVLLREQMEPAVLGAVGVLVLVDQDMAEGAAVAVAHLLVQLEEVHGAEEQVVEVHRVGRVEALLVQVVDVGRGLLEESGHLQAIGLGVQKRVLRIRDLAADPARGEALGVDVELVDAGLHEPERVPLVVDREAARVAELLRLGAQDPGAGRVEGHHPHRPGAVAHELLDAFAHLLRGLVGEGDREDLPRSRLAAPHQVRDPVREHPGLA